MHVTGQCHCGAITYAADVAPDTISLCHCQDCQRLSGSAFRAGISAPAGQFRLLTGEPRHYCKTGDSGAQRLHAFCGDCGGPVYACDPENPKSYTLRVGALDQRDALGQPARQIWTKRRLAWVPPLGDVPAIEGQQ
jgi:hypothetical protein